MNELYSAFTIIGAFILVFGLFSLFIKEKCYISETLVATIVGMIFGNNGLNMINLPDTVAKKGMLQFSRIVINLQVIAVGMVVSKEYVFRSVRSLLMLIVPGMSLSWIISTLLIHYMSDLGLMYSMIAGACITPTDPVLASTILKGKFANRYVPVHLRKLLTFESGANDGLGLILVSVPIHFIIHASNKTKALERLFVRTVLFELGLSVVVGIGVGVLARYLLIKSKEKGMIDKESFLAYTIALTFFVSGATALMGVDDIFACFVCGVFFSWYDEESIVEVKESQLLEVIDMIVNLTFFVIFGTMFPYSAFTVRNSLICLSIILFRRLPVIYCLRSMIGDLYNMKEVFFTGWFGPIGVGAIFLAYYAEELLGEKNHGSMSEVIGLVHLIVFSSVFIHGITVPAIHIHLRRSVRDMPKQLYEYSEYSETENADPAPTRLVASGGDL